MPRQPPRASRSQATPPRSARSQATPPRSARSQRASTSHSQTNGEVSVLSQSRIDQHLIFSQANYPDMVNNVVRYCIYNAGHNMYFRRAEIQKYCAPKAGQQFQQVIEQAASILKNVYGYNLLVCDPSERSGRAYIISNGMPYMNYNINRQETDPNDVKKILILLILSHIFMSNVPITEASLYTFLSNFKIETNKRHPLFGQVKDYIMNTLVKQKYLHVETDPVSKKVSFSWGVRAEKEISKHEMLKFVCKMFKDRQPKSWNTQYQTASEQGFENDKHIEDASMDVDED